MILWFLMFTTDFIPITLKNSETVKAVTLVFCSIQWIFIRDIRAKFGIPNLSQSPDIEQNSDGGFSDFFISGQSLTNANCHNSGTSNDIDMKLGPVTKLDKNNVTGRQTSESLTMKSCRQIMTILSFFWFMANTKKSGSRIPDA